MIYPTINYAAKCNHCGKDYEGYIGDPNDSFSFRIMFDDESSLESDIEDSDWHVEDGKHYCPDCFEGWDEDDNVVLKEIKG